MIIDIVVLVIVLLAVIVGIVRGTFKSFLKLCSILVALGLTLLMVDTVARFILNTPLMTELILGQTVSLKTLYAEIGEGWQNSALLNAIYAPMVAKLQSLGVTDTQAWLPTAMAFQNGIVLGCLMVYLVFRIIIMVIAFIIKRLKKKGRKSGWSRFVGLFLGAINGAFIVSILFSLVIFVTPIKAVGNIMNDFTKDSIFVSNSTKLTQQITTKFAVSDDNLKQALQYAGYTFTE